MRRAMAVVAAGAFVVAACGDDGGGSTEAFCATVERFVAFDDPSTGEADPENIAEARDIVSDLADNAPSQISADVELTTDAFTAFLDVLETADETGEEAAGEAINAIYEDPDIETASDNVNDFARAECGVDMDGFRR